MHLKPKSGSDADRVAIHTNNQEGGMVRPTALRTALSRPEIRPNLRRKLPRVGPNPSSQGGVQQRLGIV